jgi:hypothetical protein
MLVFQACHRLQRDSNFKKETLHFSRDSGLVENRTVPHQAPSNAATWVCKKVQGM